jgi:hypothetical protein
LDRLHDVDTDGRCDGWTHLSDLEIPSANWIEGNDYAAIEPRRFERVLTALDIRYEDFTFVDFDSGKGRALLLASEFPFKRILGVEFSEELHRTAEETIRRYRSRKQQCQNIQSLNLDFTNFVMPIEPSFLFFFNPCRGRVLSEVVTQVGRSLIVHPRLLYIAYAATTPEQEQIFAASGFLEKISANAEFRFSLSTERKLPRWRNAGGSAAIVSRPNYFKIAPLRASAETAKVPRATRTTANRVMHPYGIGK